MTTPISRFPAVLFDCDGVLVDSERITLGVLRQMLRELDWELGEADVVRYFLGRSLRDEWPVILEHTGVRIDDTWIGAFRRRRDTALATEVTPIPGVAQALAAITADRGDRVACVSGADRGKVELQLDATGLRPFFGDRIFSGMEQPRTKPAPDVYLAAARALGVDPTTALVIEDSVAGVTAGVAAGATVYGFAPPGPTRTDPAELTAAGASLVFTDMAELPGLVGD
ncbi:HAD family phosphatase [Agromyces endophyticus]|uniref:HAD family hydrolase n=1 Tax=Agromyces sp. H17E-10 TaxID=2932244 RepID=UPI001FD00A7F|nr:HAD family phosphatase [Agromyces sp. H17E-10]UOQ90287.1 HAD family phosphatase [Agromyces sp. H17E-10]